MSYEKQNMQNQQYINIAICYTSLQYNTRPLFAVFLFQSLNVFSLPAATKTLKQVATLNQHAF